MATNNRLILTPELLKKIGEEAPKSNIAIEKLESAKANFLRNKNQLEILLGRKF